MAEPVPSAKQFEDFAFTCVVAFIGFAIGAIVDGYDGTTSMRTHTLRLLDDPSEFKGALIMRWGWPAMIAAVAAIASGIGALVVRARVNAEKP
jgi:hypothetical protein